MDFWQLENRENKNAVIDLNGAFSYHQLQKLVQDIKRRLPNSSRKQLGLILCENHLLPLSAYLAGLQKKDAIMLVDQKLNHTLLSYILHNYHPDWIVTKKGEFNSKDYVIQTEMEDHEIWESKTKLNQTEINEDLALLLSTSGTTGSPKFVRLSYKNLQANAASIAEYLNLDSHERAITTLPMHYSYGLSVINSHLLVGGSLLLTNDSVLSKDFWTLFKENQATSFAGVPYTYQILQRLRFEKMVLPSLKYFTQAGGRLASELVEYFLQIANDKNLQFYVMYGQTEATARMSYVPSEQLYDKLGSIGIPIPGGKLSLDPQTSEVIYEGQNVMMGYAESLEDLAKGNELDGVLRTGDVAEVDNDGYFYITGRMKRFIKLFGLRLNLDEIEKRIEKEFATVIACTGNDDKLEVFLEEKKHVIDVKEMIKSIYKLHPSSFKVTAISTIPRLENGKINYSKLKDM